jgi:hypothetical protein
MELKRIVVQLWNGTDEYEDFVDADLRSSIRQVEVHGAESAGEGVIRIPKGMVIESITITADYHLLVRAAESLPGAISRAARAVIDSADATGGGTLTVVDRGAVLELERLVEEEENQDMTIFRSRPCRIDTAV